ncbi:hypothetical protein ACFOZ7_07435 [Natribaculum luteum]|uniref:SPW repeat-containing protein n=1 Tax=Natribaculum luteum TaxID=1586232 RepID=A0ABD5NY16_9EURY|nr:hypothetical protein [Natribaculum luteum]
MNRFDWVAVVGFGAIVATATVADLEAVVLSALLGGFVLSLALWRFSAGHVWEALGWLAWVASAVALGFGSDRPLVLAVFLASILFGLGLQLGGRLELLPDVWTAENETGE